MMTSNQPIGRSEFASHSVAVMRLELTFSVRQYLTCTACSLRLCEHVSTALLSSLLQDWWNNVNVCGQTR